MNTTNKLKYWLPIIVAVSVVCGILIGFKITGVKKYTPAQAKLAQLIGIIEDDYVDDIDIDSLIERTIPDLIRNLDPHSAYIAAADIQAANSELESTFGGIGIQLQPVGDTIHVIEVITGGPSEKAGLAPGDRIVKVDSTDITGPDQDLDKTLRLIRGEKGTTVRLTIKRTNTPKLLTFDIVRDDIPQTSIDAAYMADKTTGYVKVSKFARNTYAEFLQAINKLRVAGAERYIIDLRGNTGGFMETAIMMVNEFLPPMRRIVETRGRNGDKDTNVLSDGTGTFANSELVVLIDEFSASASEIFAGAVQDNDRGLVIGRRSFGKGLVQLPITLADSSMVRLTVQRYYTPSGRCIQKTYKPGDNDNYETEILERYNRGEVFSADSVKFNTDEKYHTLNGRIVYGGGGIMPDVFVPNDTTGVTKYYINLSNHGAIKKFAYEYADLNRSDLSKAKTIEQLLKLLPPDRILINSLVYYASTQLKVSLRPLQLDISRNLILSQLKAFIIRDILGIDAFYEYYNRHDNAVNEGLRQLERGKAAVPIGESSDDNTADTEP